MFQFGPPRNPKGRPNHPPGSSKTPKQALQTPRVLPKEPLGTHFGVIFKRFCVTCDDDLSRQL